MTEDSPISPSLATLERRLTSYFSARGISEFTLLSDATKTRLSALETCNVVLAGDAPSYFLEPSLWKYKGSYRFWVLSNVAREFFSRLSGLPEEHFAVIPRNALFEVLEPNYTIAESRSFVYAGRFMQGKNLPLVGQVIAKLQSFPEFKNHRLYFAGSGDYESLIGAMRGYDWSHPPVYLGDLGSEWTQHPFTKPVFINLSTYAMEDFSVGTAEAQSKGWPVIISDWFGLSDVRGGQVVRIDPEHCVASQENVALIADAIKRGPVNSVESKYLDADSAIMPTETQASHWLKSLKGMGEYEKAFAHCFFSLKMGGDGEEAPEFIWENVPEPATLGRYQRAKDVIFRLARVGTKVSAIHTRHEDLFEMDGSFAKLFRCLCPDFDVSVLLLALLSEDANDPELREETKALLKDALDAGLIELVGEWK
jgi:hypothetical protein